MAKAIHMMVRVRDEQRSRDFYDRAFGLKVAERFDFDDFTLVYLRNAENDFEVELTVNKGRSEPYQVTATVTSPSRSTISTPSTGASRRSGCSPPRSRSSTATAR
jgi:catechol 2,3-dioxygenase-like lactoylglutathione lyase family enzyme